MKKCSKCHIEKDLGEFWKHPQGALGLTPSCKDCHKKALANWTLKNPEKIKLNRIKKTERSRLEPYSIKKNRHLKSKYGITIEDWKSLFESQKGCCAICNKHQSEFSTVLQTDHDHSTERVRGLLCVKCNTKLAAIEEEAFMENAIAYIKRFKFRLVK